MDKQKTTNKQINEIRALTLDTHSDFNKASQNPTAWANWALSNPLDSLKIWTEWVNAGKDVSQMASQWHPELTKCGSFPNALGYAIHLKLKYFYYDHKNYATTPQQNSSVNNGPIGGSATQTRPTRPEETPAEEPAVPQASETSPQVAMSYKERIRAAIANADMQALETAYKEAKASTKMTPGDKMDLRSAYMNGRAAIRNKKAAERRQSKNYVKMAANSLDRADRRTAKSDRALDSVGSIDEVKALIKKTIREEAKKQKDLLK
jgi:hypothetical protein